MNLCSFQVSNCSIIAYVSTHSIMYKIKNDKICLNHQSLNQSLQKERKHHPDSSDRVRSFATARLSFLTNASSVFTSKAVFIVEVDTLVVPPTRVVHKFCLHAFAGLVREVIRRDASTTSIDAHRTIKRVLTVVGPLTMIALLQRSSDTIRRVPSILHVRVLAGARSLLALRVRHSLTRQVVHAIQSGAGDAHSLIESR